MLKAPAYAGPPPKIQPQVHGSDRQAKLKATEVA